MIRGFFVLGAGLEPARPRGHKILSHENSGFTGLIKNFNLLIYCDLSFFSVNLSSIKRVKIHQMFNLCLTHFEKKPWHQ